jgi:hypothetical protein
MRAGERLPCAVGVGQYTPSRAAPGQVLLVVLRVVVAGEQKLGCEEEQITIAARYARCGRRLCRSVGHGGAAAPASSGFAPSELARGFNDDLGVVALYVMSAVVYADMICCWKVGGDFILKSRGQRSRRWRFARGAPRAR